MNQYLKIVSVEKAVSVVKSGDRVFFQGAAMTPNLLINHLCERYQELEKVEIVQIHTDGEAKYVQEPYNKSFHLCSFFVGANVRSAVNTDAGDYVPIFLSEIHWLFRRDLLPLDVAFIQVSPPDKHGYCSLGVSVDITLPAIQKAKKIVALVNPKVPRTHGDGIIHSSKIDFAVEIDAPIHRSLTGKTTAVEDAIGKNVAALIENGANLQMGIGNIPNAVLHNLGNHQRLGIHTEMFSDGILPLVEKGIIKDVREKIGAVASFREVLIVERLPKTRSGKILRKLLRDIADHKTYNIPSTIDDEAIISEIEAVYK